jgi:hypothetical protein
MLKYWTFIGTIWNMHPAPVGKIMVSLLAEMGYRWK